MKDIRIIYDDLQHCTAFKKSKGKAVGMDCPYTGKGAEFSPTDLVESALGGCILMAMGAYAMQHDIDLKGTAVDVQITYTDQSVSRFDAIEVHITMPEGISEKMGKRLERAADSCPIKHSFAKEIPVKVMFTYPTLQMV